MAVSKRAARKLLRLLLHQTEEDRPPPLLRLRGNATLKLNDLRNESAHVLIWALSYLNLSVETMKSKLLIIMGVIISLFYGECNAQWIRVDKDTIKLDGDIDRDSYQSYLDAAAGGYSKVVLKSSGGFPMPALMIAEEIRKISPEIIVESHCLSACANYLLLASPAPHVECGALIIWHGSPSNDFDSNIRIMHEQNKNLKLIEKYEAWSRKYKSMEDGYFTSIGVNKKILSDSVAIVSRDKVAPEVKFEFDDMTGNYSETVSSGLWIPAVKVIRSYGVDTRNFCPTYDADIPSVIKRLGIEAPYTTLGP